MQQLKQLPRSKWFRVEQQSLRGTPDCMGCVRGLFVAIEFKRREKERPTKLQQYELDAVIGADGIAIVAYPENWNDVFMALLNLAETGNLSAPDGTTFN